MFFTKASIFFSFHHIVFCEPRIKNWHHSLFWQYLSIRVLLDVLRASSLMLFEGALIVTIKEQVNITNNILHNTEIYEKNSLI